MKQSIEFITVCAVVVMLTVARVLMGVPE